MILPAQHIRQLAKEKHMIEPFTERGITNGKTFGLGPATYDMRCKQTIVLMPAGSYWRFQYYQLADWLRTKLGRPTRYHEYRLGFALVSTIEKVHMPDDVCATVMDKSSWARKGMAAQNTHFDPGFVGYPTLELSNHGHEDLLVLSGMPVCQFKFEKLLEPTEMPYRGKYQNQPDKVVHARDGVSAWA